ncbi:MAG TPA: 1,2-phenylacetyl-CoA epoxidase subunit PaaE [Puia sp.]|jgi:ring-1,2-phenylacetyl-CoA epoxidase subunit PaaE|nr:1,2-phenylacetyl-CoA epoxidase subunit PaaE [Puia sp.]
MRRAEEWEGLKNGKVKEINLALVMATHFRTLKIGDVRRETAECISVAFTVPEAFREEFQFFQGQNITLRVRMGEEEVRRSYSICSSPLEGELRVAIKKVEGGRFSTWANERLAPGHELEVLPPSGRFYTELGPGNRKRYLAFAAGSGITPVISLIKTTLAVEPESSFTLVYGNRNRLSILFREELEALKNRYIDRFSLYHILSREEMDIPLYRGRIDTEKCAELCGKLIELSAMDEVFLCGPEQMIFSVKDWLEGQGVERRKIHFELFHTLDGGGAVRRSVVAEGGATVRHGEVSRVTVRLDGMSHTFDLPFEGASVLETALMEGVDLPFACKGGVCSTCRARLLEGKVEMDANYALEADELAAGFILTCQSHPRSGRVVIDFDSK